MDDNDKVLIREIFKLIFSAKIVEMDTLTRFMFKNTVVENKLHKLFDQYFVDKTQQFRGGNLGTKLLNFVWLNPEISATYGFTLKDNRDVNYNGRDIYI